jgi:6-phosphogluconolactonase
MPVEHHFDSVHSLAPALAASVAADLRDGLRRRGRASLVVSGGRTPALVLSALSRHALDWANVWISLADERWVNEDHPDSNAALVRRYLLQHYAASANFVPLKNSAPTPAQGEEACEAAIATIPRPFDVVLLGMGDDGHTASLFPDNEQLGQAFSLDSGRLCIAIDPIIAPHSRMSLTLPALLQSRRIVLLFSGAAKWSVYQRALQPGPATLLPVRAVLHQTQVPIEIFYHD